MLECLGCSSLFYGFLKQPLHFIWFFQRRKTGAPNRGTALSPHIDLSSRHGGDASGPEQLIDNADIDVDLWTFPRSTNRVSKPTARLGDQAVIRDDEFFVPVGKQADNWLPKCECKPHKNEDPRKQNEFLRSAARGYRQVETKKGRLR